MVGASGCGKSTIVNLLLRYYDVGSGEVWPRTQSSRMDLARPDDLLVFQVCIDGENIKHLNLQWLRHTIAVVSQEPILFDATVEENIRFGRMDVTKNELIEAAKMASAHDFICTLPEASCPTVYLASS